MDVENSCDIVDVVQQVCAKNLPVDHGGPWQAKKISVEQDAILAKAIEVEQSLELVNIYLIQLL